MMLRTKVFRLLSFVATLLFLQSCGDFIDNALGINSDPSQNRPMSLDGVWSGRFSPAQKWRHLTHNYPDPLKKPCVTSGADVRLEVDGETVTGQVLTDEGQRLDLKGEAWAGAWHTGRNSINGTLHLRGRQIGHVFLRPGAGRDQITGTYRFRLSPDRYSCSNAVTLTRIAGPAP
ncbi:hypothetical protein AADZ90_000375 [Aestuariibius sp. 2305UL40-4]|uniref:hypothetical protein n=1 Tax=Aestuariibius violaceus TaxID=3234132 RepID=UPI00345E9EC8